MLEGRDPAREAQYAIHLKHKMEDAGIPSNWVERDTPPLEPAFLRSLRAMAAEAPDKAPVRRLNFKRLAQAFDGRLQLLADAVEMHLPTLLNVAEGRLPLDDYRFNHINPRLMRAGFADGWLEEPNPELHDSMLEKLEQMATDEYEKGLGDEDDVLKNVGQTFVSPAPEQVVAAQVKLAAPAVEPQQKEIEMATSPQQQQHPEEATRSGLPPLEFKAAGFPASGAPMQHPSAGGAKVPRGALVFGAKKAAKAGVAAPTSTATSAPAAPVVRAPRATITKEVSLARANALEKLLEGARRGAKVTLWRDIMNSSLPFWGNMRRGAVLFRDDLAEKVTEALGLPNGWLDNPTFPPATIAPWVMDANVPRPGADGKEASAPTTASAPASTPAAAPAPAPTAAPAAAPTKRPYTRRTPAVSPQLTLAAAPPAGTQLTLNPPPASAPATPVVVASAPAPAPVAAPVAVSPVASPVSVPSAQTAWPASQGQPGPICQALVSTLSTLSASGAFSEQDALQMLNTLMTRR